MISFCTISINSKHETRTFVEALACHNQGYQFEICITHDDRVEDGSAEYLQELQRQYPMVKLVSNSKQDTIQWLTKLISWYDTNDMFPSDFRAQLKKNLTLYIQNPDVLYEADKSYLWTALGHLYNKAARIASGDILIFAPVDYIWTMNLRDLESYIIQHRRNDGIFYGKFSGLLDKISNEPTEHIRMALASPDNISHDVHRHYLSYPSRLEDHYHVDFLDNKAYCIADNDYPQRFISYCQMVKDNRDLYAPMHHGTHVMTRKLFEIIGGFTEEFYARAWPDDKMNSLAMKIFWNNASLLPPDFAFHWLKMAQINPWTNPAAHSYVPEQALQRDPWFYKHPIQGRDYHQTYLHDGYPNQEYIKTINSRLDGEFALGAIRGREAPAVFINRRG